MPSKLKNLKVTKVDFVDEGANPDANIRLFKRREEPAPPECQAGTETEKNPNFWGRVFGSIAKAFSTSEDFDSAMEVIRKDGAVSFGEKISERNSERNYEKIASEIWDTFYALYSSFCSILLDEDLDGAAKASAMRDGLTEFNSVIDDAIKQWSGGNPSSIVAKSGPTTETEITAMKAARNRLDSMIASVVGPDGEDDEEDGPHKSGKTKGDETEMKIDKSKLTEAERAFLDSIEKRCGMEEGEAVTPPAGAPKEAAPNAADGVQKSAATPAADKKQGNAPAGEESEDIYKGMHPAVRAELESLKKFREEAEDRELREVAKKYEIIGRKAEELAPVLKSLKAAGGTAYNDMIAMLDQTVEAVNKSGLFSEIGRNGHKGGENSAEAKISGIAKKYIEDDPAMSYQQAVAKAWEDHPELMKEYDEQEGF